MSQQVKALFRPRTISEKGNIGFISQCDGLGEIALELAGELNLGISLFAGLERYRDIPLADILEYYHRDLNTQLILMYLENLGSPQKFMQIARRITKVKPIIVVKSGKPVENGEPLSHTGVLADPEATINALFTQCGVLRVSTIESMFMLAMVFAHQPFPRGNRVAVLSNGGGPGQLAKDSLLSQGLTLATLSGQTRRELQAKLPSSVRIANPLNLITAVDEGCFPKALSILLRDAEIDAVMALFVAPRSEKSTDVAQQINGAVKDSPAKTLVTCLMGHQGVLGGVATPETPPIPVYRFPESAAKVLAAMERFAHLRTRKEGHIRTFEADRATVRRILAQAKLENRRTLSEREVWQVLGAYGFQFARSRVVTTPEEALSFHRQCEGAVVLKLISPDILHKSDFGGVKVDLRTEEEIREGFREILGNIEKRFPYARTEGFVIQEMIPEGKEIILGMRYDPRYGLVIMFGQGGIYVEEFRDVSFRMAPLSDADALEMINSLKSSPLLKGVRGERPVNIGFIIENLQRLSQLAVDFETMIREIDINPLIVSARPEHCKIADAKIVV